MSKTCPPFFLTPPCLLYLLLLTLPSHGNSQTADSELAILLKLKQDWSNPPSLSHWNPSSNAAESHCRWPEINCTGGSITELKLQDKNITRIVPPYICDLKNLTLLDLHDNYIPGPFPTFLYNCSQLQYLDLSQNYFVGPIPGDIHRMSPRLQHLNMEANNFTDDIPASIGRLSQLRNLSLAQNQFHGSFPPEIGDLFNLEELRMTDSYFAPSRLPRSFMRLRKLRKLWMSNVNLIGEIPDTIWNWTAMEELDLSMNRLTGNIPDGLFQLKNLTFLFLYKNTLSGQLPRSIEALNLQVIDVSENILNGTIPDDFGKLTKLSGFPLFFNQFSGEVPSSIGRLPALRDIRWFGNNLSGELPPDFGRYSNLREFQVANNQFTGRLPEHLCASGNLTGLVAFNNRLTGELPSSLGNCGTLSTIMVYNNQLSGEIPVTLWTSVRLGILMLSDNFFTGHLPDRLATNLSRIEISNNRFSGEIPASISLWGNLTVFEASNNLFSGSIPQELTALRSLTKLLLDGNQLAGHFPPEIISWRALTSLSLRGNKLSGQIPAQIGKLPSLTDLDLSENQFSGEIPPEIGRLRLTSFNLSSNRLTGRIPSEFENAAFQGSFLNNSGLCAGNPTLRLPDCSSRGSGKISTQLLAALISIAATLFLLAIVFTLLSIRAHRKRELGSDLSWKLVSFQRLSFTESDILSSLSESNMIGSGGSGKVYRVQVNRSGDFVAVKRISNNRKLEQKLEKEFMAEVEILGTIRHDNIVKLLCCLSSEASKLLVYEYLENCSLDRWLHGRKKRPSAAGSVHDVVLDWPKRLQIAAGAAQGLCYMHHHCKPPIVHRDVKSSNILLDSNFAAKIADFGLAKALAKQGEPNTMSAVAGSFGYIAPEYANSRRVSEKTDVYSFGVVLLELATGKEPNNGDENSGLAEWAWRHIQEGKRIVDALDGEIKEESNLEEMSGVFKLGILCTNTLPTARPTMKEVLRILLHCNQPQPFAGKIGAREFAAPLLKNSRHQRMLDDDYDCLPITV